MVLNRSRRSAASPEESAAALARFTGLAVTASLPEDRAAMDRVLAAGGSAGRSRAGISASEGHQGARGRCLCHDERMTDRLSATDAAFLYAEDASTPMHVGGAVILQPEPGTFDYQRVVELISARLSLVPRYRQRVRFVPGRLARPVWVDDEDFDLTYHVRRSALPKPGTDAALDDLIGRLISRPLDRRRPLWEMYVIEGLSGGRIAIVNKTHHAMVDRIGAVDVAAAILDIVPPGTEPAGAALDPDAAAERHRPGRRCHRRHHQPAVRADRSSVSWPPPMSGRRVAKVAHVGVEVARGDSSDDQSGAAFGAQRDDERAAAVRHVPGRPGRPQGDPDRPRRIGERRDPRRHHRRIAHVAAVPR